MRLQEGLPRRPGIKSQDWCSTGGGGIRVCPILGRAASYSTFPSSMSCKWSRLQTLVGAAWATTGPGLCYTCTEHRVKHGARTGHRSLTKLIRPNSWHEAWNKCELHAGSSEHDGPENATSPRSCGSRRRCPTESSTWQCVLQSPHIGGGGDPSQPICMCFSLSTARILLPTPSVSPVWSLRPVGVAVVVGQSATGNWTLAALRLFEAPADLTNTTKTGDSLLSRRLSQSLRLSLFPSLSLCPTLAARLPILWFIPKKSCTKSRKKEKLPQLRLPSFRTAVFEHHRYHGLGCFYRHALPQTGTSTLCCHAPTHKAEHEALTSTLTQQCVPIQWPFWKHHVNIRTTSKT